jgi:hypothetical protein
VDITTIREFVRQGRYLVKGDCIRHAVKESFVRQDIVDAVLTGRIIEDYPERERVLVCGRTKLSTTTIVYLHVVCEYADPNYIHFVTTYIPDEVEWERPPFRRKKKR